MEWVKAHKWLLLGVVGGAIVLWWYESHKSSSSTAPATTTTTTTTTTPPTTSTPPPTTTPSPTTVPLPALPPLPAITPSQPSPSPAPAPNPSGSSPTPSSTAPAVTTMYSVPPVAQLGGTQGSVPNVGTQVVVPSGASPSVIAKAASHALSSYAQASGSGKPTAPALVTIGSTTMPAAQAASLPSSAFMGGSGGGLVLNPNYNPDTSPAGSGAFTSVGGEMVPLSSLNKSTPVTGQYANPAAATVGASSSELAQVASLQAAQAAQIAAYNANPQISALRQALNTTSAYTTYQGQLVPTWTLRAKLAQLTSTQTTP